MSVIMDGVWLGCAIKEAATLTAVGRALESGATVFVRTITPTDPMGAVVCTLHDSMRDADGLLMDGVWMEVAPEAAERALRRIKMEASSE